jgi:hypothetical protein
VPTVVRKEGLDAVRALACSDVEGGDDERCHTMARVGGMLDLGDEGA